LGGDGILQAAINHLRDIVWHRLDGLVSGSRLGDTGIGAADKDRFTWIRGVRDDVL